MPMLLQPESLWHVKSITGFMSFGQPTFIPQLQRIPTLDDSTTKGHYTNFNLVFKASRRVYHLRHTATLARHMRENFGSMLF